MTPIWAVLPIKETTSAKQRLTDRLPAEARQQLALAMVEDVLAALGAVRELAGLIAVTVDPRAGEIARRYGARIAQAGARDGHTGAVVATGRQLARDGQGMMTVPGDIPMVTPEEVRQVLSAHRQASSFTIVPARDLQGSNCIVMSPADAVPLRFGEDSYFPHLAAAERAGIKPTVLRLPGIGHDVDTPEDLAALEAVPGATRTHALLARWRTARAHETTGAA
jgi:2-phospho-L-lactate guanylyltransferase